MIHYINSLQCFIYILEVKIWTDRVKKGVSPCSKSPFPYHAAGFSSHPPFLKRPNVALLQSCRDGQHEGLVIDFAGKGRNCALQ